jgi:hypothetical protein
MQHEEKPSQKQLELQARIAQRRIDQIQKVLASGVQAEMDPVLADDAKEVISRLFDASLSEEDISSCIDILKLLLLPEGAAPLMGVMKNDSYSIELRKQAALAIWTIGGSDVVNELEELRSTASPVVSSLAEIALGIEIWKDEGLE